MACWQMEANCCSLYSLRIEYKHLDILSASADIMFEHDKYIFLYFTFLKQKL